VKGAAFVSVLLLALVFAAGASSAVKPLTLNLLEVQTAFTPTGGLDPTYNTVPKVGQGFVIESAFYKWNGTKRGAQVGTLQVVCTTTKQNSAPSYQGWVICTGAALFGGSQVAVAGSIKQSNNFSIPIVGGTGVYAGARGYVQVESINDTKSNDKFVISGLAA